MKTRLSIILLASLALLGFRTVSPEERAKDIIQRAEGHFTIQEYAELYRYVRITNDGDVFEGQMLIIFRYKDDKINGVFRLLPDDDNKGVTLLSRQEPNQRPKLEMYDHNTDEGGPVELSEVRKKLGDTDWYLEGIYDDDHNPWIYENVKSANYRGYDVDVIVGRYRERDMRDATGYDHRRMLIRKSDEQPLSIEFYDYSGQLIYCVDLLSNEHFDFQGETKSRTRQLQLIDFQTGSTTVLTRIRSNWNPQLPEKIYALEYADDWNEETDRLVTSKLMRDLNSY
ncbi:outer membrane lipoprotein-sorting protein [Cerasicoccus fimbriatus]|uniref:outer membrane lipoprotein-sorting protein n=1 Tax=Cerasicoccus fimbriatus TaxID=3014554 RepID=UPI0022B5B756|nr:outer membrane lipoprotein-sorting protein [Cerasicoccus sp. TK19100]